MSTQISPRYKKIGVVLVGGIGLLVVAATCFGFDISIKVSPNVLNIASKGEVVTVHHPWRSGTPVRQ